MMFYLLLISKYINTFYTCSWSIHGLFIICNVRSFILHYQDFVALEAQFQENFKMRNIHYGINIAEKWPNSDHTITRTAGFVPTKVHKICFILMFSFQILADVFQDLLANKDDYLRAVRGLLREIVRSLKHDINITSFCLGLMQERMEAKFMDLDHNLRVSGHWSG